MKSKILFTWLGMTDLKASEGDEKAGLGPLCQACKKYEFDEINLITNFEEEKYSAYIDWLATHTNAKVSVRLVTLENPTDHEKIFLNVKKVVEDYNKKTSNQDLYYHLSPGTPAMASVWVLMVKTSWPATLIESSWQQGVKEVKLPFDIALDYLPSIQSVDHKLSLIAQALPPEEPEWSDIIHKSTKMKEIILRARKIAMHDVPVIVQGESGTGKELFARAIHHSSLRNTDPFIAVNCGALPKDLVESHLFGYDKGAFTGADKQHIGFLEEADGGTVFLDELGELPLDAQVKLLRVLQDQKLRRVGGKKDIDIDIRIIAATNRNLIEEVSLGNFREDLFHRLAVGLLYLPPLRERSEDISLLTDHILEQISKEDTRLKHKKVSASTRKIIQNHAWTGNVRELWNTLLRASIWSTSTNISNEDIKNSLLEISSPKESKGNILNRPIDSGLQLESLLGDVARHYIERALEKTAGNKSRTTDLLGFKNYQTLTNWCKKYGVEV